MHEGCSSCKWLAWETTVWAATLLVAILLGAFTLIAATSPADHQSPARHAVVAPR